MAESPKNMVLRTVYLPRELDAELKILAFQQDRSKNDIVRELVLEGLEARRLKKTPIDPDKGTAGEREEISRGARSPQSADAAAGEHSGSRQEPAVPIQSSVKHDYIVCLEDGMKLKTLKRHLHTHYNMSPEDYRSKWGLPLDYPMVAAGYSEQRRAIAAQLRLAGKAQAAKAKAPPPPAAPAKPKLAAQPHKVPTNSK